MHDLMAIAVADPSGDSVQPAFGPGGNLEFLAGQLKGPRDILMAVVNDVFAACSSILDLVSKIQTAQESWTTVSDEYRSKADLLRTRLQIYKDLMGDRRISENDSLMRILKQAEEKVKEQELKAKELEGHINNNQCCSWGWWIWAKVSMILFPKRLEQIITEVIQEINKIPDILETQEKAAFEFQKYDKRQPIRSTTYDNDRLYVPIEKTQSKVMRAIENGPLVVFLHGRVGTGKTILAKFVCEYYQGTPLFEHVHFESCVSKHRPAGPSTMCDTKMWDVLKSLSPTSLSDSQSGSGSQIASSLHNFLKGKKVLIALDHVSDEELLLEMWKAAQECPHVKYLVTSQIPHLCHNLTKSDTMTIAMEDATQDEARQILASLVGLESRVIPISLEAVADKVIADMEGNPLALACWAANFYNSRNKTEEQAWWGAHDNMRNLLNGREKRVVLGNNQRRSLWEAMELCIKSLDTCDAEVILFLMYACCGAWVPEEVLKIWQEGINPSSTFWKSLDELSSRGLIEGSTSHGGLQPYLEEQGQGKQLHDSRTWSLRPLVKLFVEHFMASKNETLKNEIVHVMGSLLGDEKPLAESSIGSKPAAATKTIVSEKVKIAIALCALYFNPAHTDQVVIDVRMRARSASSRESDSLLDLRRQVMEPIIWLLGQPKRTTWTEQGLSSARKVFVQYIYEHQLDGDNFSTLLMLDVYPTAQLATLTALLSIWKHSNTLVPSGKCGRILESLLVLVDSKAIYSARLKELAFQALEIILHVMFDYLSLYDKPELQVEAALTLAVLAFGGKDAIGTKVVNENRAVADLVKSLSHHDKGDLKEQVAGVLRKLTSNLIESVNRKIAVEEGILAGLAKSLSDPEKSRLQADALFAFFHLSITDASRPLIVKEPGALVGLVKCLSDHKTLDLHEPSAKALANLALDVTMIPELMRESGIISGLVKCLSEHVPQEVAVRALMNLSRGDFSTKLQIAKEDGALRGLVKCLSVHNKPDTRWFAVVALENLSKSKVIFIKVGIANEPGALQALVKILFDHDKPHLRLEAVQVFRNLASSKDDFVILKIINEDQALRGIVDCLSEPDKPELQEHAVTALWGLGSTIDSSLKERIRNENGLLTGLDSLTKQGTPILQEAAKHALSALWVMQGESGG